MLLCVLAFGAIRTSSAQLAVYGDLNVTRLSEPGGAQKGAWHVGPQVGVYDEFLHLGPIAAGLDLRGDLTYSSTDRFRDVLLGVRAAAHPPLLPVRPYMQVSAGLGGSKYNSTGSSLGTPSSNKLQYQFFGGVDMTVLPHIDLRLAEVGYGRNKNDSGTATLVTVSSGLVLRFW